MLSAELAGIVEGVWQTMDKQIRVSATPPAVRGAALTGTIGFEGAWPGTIVTTCSEGLARDIASAMFHVAPESATAEDLRDAVGELVNIIGGNVRPLLDQPCVMSLPSIAEGERAAASGESEIDAVHFVAEGGSLVVRLVRTDSTH
jgi:chemotaxis protein CheX